MISTKFSSKKNQIKINYEKYICERINNIICNFKEIYLNNIILQYITK